jgi:dTDP-4-dehydrorhamnose 3,5-epimerase
MPPANRRELSMEFSRTRLADAMVIDMQRHADSRGFFARTFCAREFAEAGLVTEFVQDSQSYNRARGTLRGMHFQTSPHREVKLVRCIAGAVFDVIIDLRAASPSYLEWEGFELSAESGRTLYVPEGFAHGFQSLADDTHVLYAISHPYAPEATAGVRHDDPVFGIAWPLPIAAISDKDAAWPPVDRAKGIRI